MMENVTETNPGQESNLPGIPAPSLGSMLREAREHLGLSVMDISGQIKFAPRQIEALEADDFQHLPEMAFVRGFVRSYAKVLHLDAETLLAALPQNKTGAAELKQEPIGERFPDAHSVLRQNLVWLGAALAVIVIVAGFALWHFTSPSEPVKAAQVELPVTLPAEMPVSSVQPLPEAAEKTKAGLPEAQPQKAQLQKQPPKTQPAKTQPAKAQPPKALAAAAQGQSSVTAASAVPVPPEMAGQAIASETQPDTSTPITSLRLEFSEDSWAEIKDKDGKILSSRLHSAGSELKVSGRAPFSLLIGHASTVSLYYRGEQIDLAPHTRRSTDVASLTLE